MSKTVDQLTPDDKLTGVEKIYVSDGGEDKNITTEQLKDFVLEQIPEQEVKQGITLSSTTW